MTYDEFLLQIHSKYDNQENPKALRLGQMFFNELLTVRPNIAKELRGSMIDPFVKERITEVVSNFVRERW